MAERYGGSLSIGAVLGRAFGVMTGNPVTVFGIALLVGALPQEVLGYLSRQAMSEDADVQAGIAALWLLSLPLFLLTSALAQSALVRASGAYLEGRNAAIGACLAAGVRKILPVIGLTILLMLGLLLGFVLFVIPAVILALMWAVAVPALVEDDAGVIESFGRSRYLTKGSRWAILALLIVVVVITWLIAALAFIPGLILGISAAGGAALSPVGFVISLITATLTTALWSTVITSLYFALRDRREGPRTEQLANVFA